MNQPPARRVAPALCPHKLNPVACLACFQQRARVPQQQAQPQRPVMHVSGEMAFSAPPEIQHAIDAQRGVQRAYEAPEPQRGEQEKIPLTGVPFREVALKQQGQFAPVAPGQGAVNHPWTSAENRPWSGDQVPLPSGYKDDTGGQGLVVPPPVRSIADRQPQHPNLHATRRIA